MEEKNNSKKSVNHNYDAMEITPTHGKLVEIKDLKRQGLSDEEIRKKRIEEE